MTNENQITVYFEPIRDKSGNIERVNENVFKAKKIDKNASVQDETIYYCRYGDSIDLYNYDDLAFDKLCLKKEDDSNKEFFLRLSFIAAKILHCIRHQRGQPDAALLPDDKGVLCFGLAEIKNFKPLVELDFDENNFFSFPGSEQKLHLSDVKDILSDAFINNIIYNSDRNLGNLGIHRTDSGEFVMVTIDPEACFASDYFENFNTLYKKTRAFLLNPITESIDDDFPDTINSLLNKPEKTDDKVPVATHSETFKQVERLERQYQTEVFESVLSILTRSGYIEKMFEHVDSKKYATQLEILKEAWRKNLRALYDSATSLPEFNSFLLEKVHRTEPAFYIGLTQLPQKGYYNFKISRFNDMWFSFIEIANVCNLTQIPSPSELNCSVKLVEKTPIFTLEGPLKEIEFYFLELKKIFNQKFNDVFNYFFDAITQKIALLAKHESEGTLQSPMQIRVTSSATTTKRNPETQPETQSNKYIKLSQKTQTLLYHMQKDTTSNNNQENIESTPQPSLSNSKTES